jgi:hypothetical protein
MAIEIIPKPVEEIPFWLRILFPLSLFLLLVTIFSYLLLIYLEKRIPAQIQKLDAEIAQAKGPEIMALEQELKMKKKKIDDFSEIINRRPFPTKFFGFAEGSFSETKKFASLIHPQVQISGFSLNLKDGKLNISGLTENFVTLEQQYLIFQKEPLAKEVNLSSFSVGKEGKVNFSFDLSFDPMIFKPR